MVTSIIIICYCFELTWPIKASDISSIAYRVHFPLTQTFKSDFIARLPFKEQSGFVSIWTRKEARVSPFVRCPKLLTPYFPYLAYLEGVPGMSKLALYRVDILHLVTYILWGLQIITFLVATFSQLYCYLLPYLLQNRHSANGSLNIGISLFAWSVNRNVCPVLIWHASYH